MNGKKTLPLLVIASLMLSILPSMMFVNAAATITLPLDGAAYVYGSTIIVTGTGVVAGTTVQLYWDDATIAWNGVKGLVNSTIGSASGAFEVRMKVPEAVNGDHYLWVKDSAGNTASVRVIVNAKVSVSPARALPGDAVTITMYGYTNGGTVTWDFATNTVTGTATANSLGTATATFTVPTVAYNPGLPVAGQIVGSLPLITATTNLAIGPVITLTPSAAVVGQLVTITGRGFTQTTGRITLVELYRGGVLVGPAQIQSYPVGGVVVDSTGRFSLSIIVPSGSAINGVGTDYSIMVSETVPGPTLTASANFEITKVTKLSVTPTYGPQGSQITVSGTGFPQVSGTTVTISLVAVAPPATTASVGSLTTGADGSISGTFNVPATTEGNYRLTATVTAAGIANSTAFKIGTVFMQISESSGPTGNVLTITGNGFTPGGNWNATIGGKTLLSTVSAGLVSGAGLINMPAYIPQMDPGTYTVTVLDIASGISLSASYTVTYSTELTITPATVPNGFNVSITGRGFWQGATAPPPYNALSFTLYNKTSTGSAAGIWLLNGQVLQKWVNVGDVVTSVPANAFTNATGNIRAYLVVPSSAILGKGVYYLNVTDSQGFKTQATLTIGDKHIVANTRKSSFAAGEIVSFTLEHSFGGDGSIPFTYVKIWNPSGALVFTSNQWLSGSWVRTGDWYTLPYSAQTVSGNPIALLDDAPTGTWTWTWYDNNDKAIQSGTFTVTQTPAGTVDEQIKALAAQITAVTTTVNNLSTTVATVATTATAASNAATAASTAASAAATAAQAATAAANAAGTKADAAKAAAESAAAAANGLTTLVYAAIGASLVAALAAIVALMQISRKIA